MQTLKNFSFSKRFPKMDVIGSSFAGNLDHLIPLSFGFPAPESLPCEAIATATTSAMKTQGPQALSYSGGSGMTHVVDWIKERSKLRNIQLDSHDLLITSGSSQGIDLVARTLADPGDEIWIEAPTFFGAIKTFKLAELTLSSFPIDDNGLQVELLEKELMYRKLKKLPMPKLLYIIPNYHNPGGVNLSIERRKKVAELAYEYNFFIIEDDAYVELSFDGTYLPSIYSFGPERVIYLSTFSKVIAPGIRIGWAIGQKEVIDHMRILKTDGHSSVFVQEVTHNVLQQLDIKKHILYLSTLYESRKNAMIDAIRLYFGNDVTFDIPKGGFFLWLTFPPSINTSDFIDQAMIAGVSYIDGKHFFLNDEGHNHMRLCFTYCNEEKIKEGIKRLADTYYAYVNYTAPIEEAE